MAPSREPPKLADTIVTAISPALIIGVVSSLVMFLAEVLYAGKYEGRLNHTLFYFSAGMVLVARIAIVLDATRAAVYGVALAVVCWIALQAYIEYPKGSSIGAWSPLINAALIGVIWWATNKLTWDCTFIDDQRPASSKGLLALAGLETPRVVAPPAQEVVDDAEVARPRREPTFFDRLKAHRARQARKPHTPGLSVIYFAIAALPIFGLGQSLIPTQEAARRSFAFWLAAVYVGCTMGLLLTTSFLGLRRYLRQRKVQMPQAMTGVWLGLGAALVLGFVLVASLLPRPYSETPLFSLNRAGSADRKASQNAVMKQDSGKGEGAAGEQTKAGDGKNTGKKGGEPGKGNAEGKKGSGAEKGKDGSGKGKESGKGKDGEQKGDGKTADGKKDEGNGKEDEGDKSGEENRGEESGNDAGSDGDRLQQFQASALGKITETLGSLIKWLVWLGLLLLVLFLVFRNGLGYLGNFFPWARRWLDALNRWWQGLFGRGVAAPVAAAAAAPAGPTHRPFSAFRNPFLSGEADAQSEEELIRYSFLALEAWAADRRQPRGPDETALEFAGRLTARYPGFEGDAQRLGTLAARMAFSSAPLPPQCRDQLEQFWDRIVEVPTRAPEAVDEGYEVVE